MPVIMIDHVTKSFGKVEVLKEFNDGKKYTFD